MKVRVGVGLGGHVFAESRAFWRWVALAEASAIDSLWCSDRLISERPAYEAMSVMAGLAGATRRLQFGMNAVVLPYRDPLVLAKQCATIDWLSAGRLITVFGVGHKPDRVWAATGRDATKRGRQADEILAIMTRLFSEDDVSFAGEFYKYQNVMMTPKPVRQPLPLWIGGNSDAAIRRAAHYGNGWLGGFTPVKDSAEIVVRVQREAEAVGRLVDADHFGVTIGFRFGAEEDEAVQRFRSMRRDVQVDLHSSVAIGGAPEILELIRRYVEVGVTKFVAMPIAADDDDLLAQTERLGEIIPAAEAFGSV